MKKRIIKCLCPLVFFQYMFRLPSPWTPYAAPCLPYHSTQTVLLPNTCPPSQFLLSLSPHPRPLPAMNINGTLVSRCAAMCPLIQKKARSTFCAATCTQMSSVDSYRLCFSLRVWLSYSSHLVSQILTAVLFLLEGVRDKRPIKYLWINIHSSVWQKVKACDRKSDMTCLCTTCSRGVGPLAFCSSGCVSSWWYCYKPS